jgi:hypothetical protein
VLPTRVPSELALVHRAQQLLDDELPVYVVSDLRVVDTVAVTEALDLRVLSRDVNFAESDSIVLFDGFPVAEDVFVRHIGVISLAYRFCEFLIGRSL